MHARLLGSLSLIGLVTSAVSAQVLPPAPRAGASSAPPPALVVLITVDQLRADYYRRYSHQLTGGLARLYRGGAVFTNAHQDHAVTETAPGHASTLSGRHPRGTGIVSNSAGVYDPQRPLIDSNGPGASPFRFRGTTLMDWLRFKDPSSRALSVSRKDRGAILPLGRTKQSVYWWAPEGRFTTSVFYHDTLPTWVERFNARGSPQRLAGLAWTLLRREADYPEPDSVPAESRGQGYTFPHVLPADSLQVARAFAAFPWMDSLTVELALEGVQALGLGTGPQTDLLAVSLSTTDAVGHQYGPDSRELHDQILRLDRYLGAFIDSLYVLRDSARIAIALTSDHGVAPFPQVHAGSGDGSRFSVDIAPAFTTLRSALRSARLDSTAVTFDDGMVLVGREALSARRAGVDSVVRAFATALRRIPGVQRVDLVNELRGRDVTRDTIARRWINMLPPDLPVAAVITLRPYHVWGGLTYAQHGTPHDYDTHVPIIFYGPHFRAGSYDRFARVVDIAPTLARATRTTPAERLEGVVLGEALR